MRKFVKVMLKVVFIICLLITLIFVGSSIYIVTNHQKIISLFFQQVEEQVELELTYSKFKLSLIEHFPFASFTFDDLLVKYPKGLGADTLMSSKKLSLTINSLNLVRGNYSLKSCIIEDGKCNYYPKVIDSLYNSLYGKPTQNADKSSHFLLNKFILKNYSINIYDYSKASGKLIIDEAVLRFIMDKSQIELSFKSVLSKIYIKKVYTCNYPLKVEGCINKKDNLYKILFFNINVNTIKIITSGEYNYRSGELKLIYSSNCFNFRKAFDLIPAKFNFDNYSGKTKLSGSLNYNVANNYFEKLDIHHLSSIKFKHKENYYSIKDLTGNTQITNNFKDQYTSIENFNYNSNGKWANLTAKIKGIKTPIILIDGTLGLSDSKMPVLDKYIDCKADAKVKILLSVPDFLTADSVQIKYHNVDGLVNFKINAISGINRIGNITGAAEIGKDLIVKAGGEFDGKPFQLNITQPHIINYLSDDLILSPSVSINAESLDVDYLTSLFQPNPSSKGKKSENKYNITVNAKELKYLDYVFKNVTSSIFFTDNIFEIQKFDGTGFDGNINGYLKNTGNEYSVYTCFNNIDITKLFEHYNNFSQAIVTSNNFSGGLSGTAIMNFSITEGKINYPALNLKADITLNDGKLRGMNKIKKLSKWLNLDQVKTIDFKTLHNTIEISDQCVKIPKMDVLSNVINMQLSGEHNFSGNYTYWMKINFSQILSRKLLKSSPDELESTSDGSINLYLKLFGNENNYEVHLDKKSSLEKIKANLKPDGPSIKELMRDEFDPEKSADSTNSKTNKENSTNANSVKFTVEWDEYDTSKVE